MRLKSLLAPLTVATALGAAVAIPAGAHDDVPRDAGAGADDTPCLTIDLRQGRRADPACEDLPHFKASFLNRVWSFKGALDSFDNGGDHSLSITVDYIEDLPRRFRNQDDDLLNQDATVLMHENIRVFSPDGDLVPHDELANADYVRVRARVLRPRMWRANEDGDVVPTLRAKRIYIKDWIGDHGDEEEPVDVDPECPEEEPKPEAGVKAANGC